MTFFSDPEHVWIAVVVGCGVSLVSAAIYSALNLIGLWRFLGRMERMDKERERRASLREDSQDEVNRNVTRSLESISIRLERRDRKDLGVARALGAMHHRIQRLEGKN